MTQDQPEPAGISERARRAVAAWTFKRQPVVTLTTITYRVSARELEKLIQSALTAERADALREQAEERVKHAFESARKATAEIVRSELEVEKFPPGFFERRYGAPKGMSQQETFAWLVERSNRLDEQAEVMRQMRAALAGIAEPNQDEIRVASGTNDTLRILGATITAFELMRTQARAALALADRMEAGR